MLSFLLGLLPEWEFWTQASSVFRDVRTGPLPRVVLADLPASRYEV